MTDNLKSYLGKLFCRHKSVISFPAYKSQFNLIEMIYCKNCHKLIDIQEHKLLGVYE